MRHLKKSQRLVGGKDRRRLLLRNLVVELIDHQKIVTTLAKAKAVKSYFDKIVTLARKNSLHHKRLLISRLGNNKRAAFKLLNEVLPQLGQRVSGFTSLRCLNRRRGDNSLLAEIKLLKEEKKENKSSKKQTKETSSPKEVEEKKLEKTTKRLLKLTKKSTKLEKSISKAKREEKK